MPSLDIIIVNYNAGQHLRQCLESIDQASKTGFEISNIVVVDNNSADGSMLEIPDLNVPIKTILNRQNKGFAVACNQGTQSSNAGYLLFLNPDVKLLADSLRAPLDFMEKPENEKIGICGIYLMDSAGNAATACALFPTFRTQVQEILGLPRFFPKRFPRLLIRSDMIGQSGYVDQVIGAFFLIRNSLFQSLDGFDERFFVYFEEVDLSLRAKQSGYLSYYLSTCYAYHVGCVSSSKVSSNSLFYYLSSRYKYAQKHYRPFESQAILGLTCTLELIIRLFIAVIGVSLNKPFEVLRAYHRLLLGIVWANGYGN